jgi:hypothetical protein
MRMAGVRKSRIENMDGKGWPKILEAAKTYLGTVVPLVIIIIIAVHIFYAGIHYWHFFLMEVK